MKRLVICIGMLVVGVFFSMSVVHAAWWNEDEGASSSTPIDTEEKTEAVVMKNESSSVPETERVAKVKEVVVPASQKTPGMIDKELGIVSPEKKQIEPMQTMPIADKKEKKQKKSDDEVLSSAAKTESGKKSVNARVVRGVRINKMNVSPQKAAVGQMVVCTGVLANETKEAIDHCPVTLQTTDGYTATRELYLHPEGSEKVRFNWKPSKTGSHTVTMSVSAGGDTTNKSGAVTETVLVQ